MGLPFTTMLLPVLLVGARVGGLMTFLPFLGSTAIAWRIKAGLTMAITAVLAPLQLSVAHPALATVGVVGAAGLVVNELGFGVLIGLALQFVFEGMQLAGQILGFQLGFSLANLIDPTSPVNTPVVSVFHQLIALYIFLQLDVHHWVLRSLASSFRLAPLGQFSVNWVVTHGLLQLGQVMWVVGVQIAAPALLATFLIDWTLGFVSKASPQFPVLFVGMSIKSMLGLAIVGVSVAYWPRYLESHFTQAIFVTEHLLQAAH